MKPRLILYHDSIPGLPTKRCAALTFGDSDALRYRTFQHEGNYGRTLLFCVASLDNLKIPLDDLTVEASTVRPDPNGLGGDYRVGPAPVEEAYGLLSLANIWLTWEGQSPDYPPNAPIHLRINWLRTCIFRANNGILRTGVPVSREGTC